MTSVLTAVGNLWDSQIATTLEGSREITLARRCADLADLLATAAAGVGTVALVSDDLRGLDLSAVHALRDAGVIVIGLADSSDEHAERFLRQLGITTVVPAGSGLDVLEPALLGRTDADPLAPLEPQANQADQADPVMRDVTDEIDDDVVAPRDEPACIVAVWGPTGAPGRTTLAVNLAAELAAAGHHTLLVDADTYGACIAQALSLLDEAPGIAAAARAAEQGTLDAAALARLAPTVTDKLRVLTGVPSPSRWTEIRGAAMTRVLEQARLVARYVVIDTGFCLEDDEELSYDTAAPRRNATTRIAVEQADILIAVGAADSIALTRLMRSLSDLSLVTDVTPHVVINRVRSASVGVGPQDRLRQVLQRFGGVSAPSFVSDDPDVLDSALLAGRTLVESAPGSRVRRDIAAITHEVVLGRSGESPVTAQRRARGLVRRA